MMAAGENRIQSDGLFGDSVFGKKSEDKLHKASNADVSHLLFVSRYYRCTTKNIATYLAT